MLLVKKYKEYASNSAVNWVYSATQRTHAVDCFIGCVIFGFKQKMLVLLCLITTKCIINEYIKL